MNFEGRLRTALTSLPLEDLRVRVETGDFNKYLVFVVSPDFEQLEEGDRQVLVWNHLRQVFSLDEMAQIQFFFTDAPSEIAN